VKWDDQPASIEAARESLLRAAWLATTAPMAPVYVNLDAGLQEAPLPAALPPLDPARYRPPIATAPHLQLLGRAAHLLRKAARPVILAGRVSRDPADWSRRVALAETLGARVVTDLKLGAAFPTEHPLHAGSPGVYLAPEAMDVLRAADAVLSLDWVDLAGTLKAVFGATAPAPVVQASLDHVLHNGWSMDHQGFPPVDIHLAADPDAVVTALLAAIGPPGCTPVAIVAPASPAAAEGAISVDAMARALRGATVGRDVSLLHVPLSWNGATWPFRHPLDFLGSDGGGGIGAGPGLAVGSALALRGSGRLPIAVLGDGDFLMGATALWTAVHYRIPLLIVVANNCSFFNDEVHQERVARVRGREVANKWIGQRIAGPEIDLAGLATAQGADGIGPVTRVEMLETVFAEALAALAQGRTVVVDVRVAPGYTPAMTAGLTQAAS
jgi:thiamine pyrophosphate-dependent acetolactate synthase large subunit-like protein